MLVNTCRLIQMTYRSKFSQYNIDVKVVVFVTISLLVASNTIAEERLSYQETQIIVAASAQVLLKQNTTRTLLEFCANKFKHLSESAHKASQNWQKQHTEVVNNAITINRSIARTIETYDSIFAAEKFTLKIDSQIYDSTQKIKAEITNKSRKQQHYLCNRLILSTAMGEWDLLKLIPEHVRRVNKFKIKD